MERLHIIVLAASIAACTPQTGGPGDPTGGWSSADAITYRDDLASHPGCTTAGLSYPAAEIAGYPCAAKAYAFPSGVSEDTAKPIVLLIHGNSDTPAEWEHYPDDGPAMIADALAGEGFRVFAIDLRIDENDDPQSNNDTENAARNVDHGWATPLAQKFIAAAMQAFPTRHFAVIGFSLGVTVTRDALRRLTLAGDLNPWERLDHVILLAGASHGVSTFAKLCGKNPTMRGRVACELGNRDHYTPTDFLKALNGPSGAHETPCADGDSAFGRHGACGGHTVKYTTVVMRDIADGSYQDEFVSQASTALAGADNQLIDLADVDETGYFFGGLLKNHYGSCRSAKAISIVKGALK